MLSVQHNSEDVFWKTEACVLLRNQSHSAADTEVVQYTPGLPKPLFWKTEGLKHMVCSHSDGTTCWCSARVILNSSHQPHFSLTCGSSFQVSTRLLQKKNRWDEKATVTIFSSSNTKPTVIISDNTERVLICIMQMLYRPCYITDQMLFCLLSATESILTRTHLL